MDWLKRATREFSERAQDPTIKTIKTQVSEVLKVPRPDFSQKTEAAATTPTDACARCLHFRAKPGQTPDGWCRKHRTETWSAYANGCADDWTLADSAARELERRRADVVVRLTANPALRYSFDVANASPTGPAERPVSVMLGLRTASGSIVTGEARIPANRWPGPALFAEHLRMAAEALPS
jgi:hypothetical protein